MYKTAKILIWSCSALLMISFVNELNRHSHHSAYKVTKKAEIIEEQYLDFNALMNLKCMDIHDRLKYRTDIHEMNLMIHLVNGIGSKESNLRRAKRDGTHTLIGKETLTLPPNCEEPPPR